MGEEAGTPTPTASIAGITRRGLHVRYPAPNGRLGRNDDKPLTVAPYSPQSPFQILHHICSLQKTWEADGGGIMDPIL